MRDRRCASRCRAAWRLLPLSNLGACRVDAAQPAIGEPLPVEALAIHTIVLAPASVVPAKALNNLDLAQQARGDLAGARSSFERALALNRAAYGASHPRVAGNPNNLALLLEAQGQLDAAAGMLHDTIAIIESTQRAAHVSLGFPLTNRGRLLLWQGDALAARDSLARARSRSARQRCQSATACWPTPRHGGAWHSASLAMAQKWSIRWQLH